MAMIKKDHLFEGLWDFPHVVKRVNAMWGTAECREYLIGLMRQTDRESRQGFPPQAFRACFDLFMLHDMEFPQHRKDPEPW